MARKTYTHTDETKRVLLSGDDAAIAREMECDGSYINGIKNCRHPDPYPKFRELFRASARSGADVSPWLSDLTAIVEGMRQKPTEEDLGAFLVTKLHDENRSTEEFLRSMSDGHLSEPEIDRLLTMFEAVKENALRGITLLARHKARLRGERPRNLRRA